MKVVILCGGKGMRMHELTEDIPKPLVNVGQKPMLWHILKTYNYYGFNDFLLLLGYKGDKIKEYFVNYKWKNHSFSLDTAKDEMHMMDKAEDWKITFLDTGPNTMTGSRIKRAQHLLENETFMLTYGDGLSDINIHKLLKFHRAKKRVATVTGIEKKSQYGTLTVKDDIAISFNEKQTNIGVINGGFFVLEPEVFNYIKDDTNCAFEQDPLVNLALDNQLAVYMHNGFWTACDTYNDIVKINNLCNQNKAKWKVW
ncbi:sugar phosphate nucleotidyltransferase [Herbivorax sp. ANBcel31]|uniref:sugar phosphate nucleotidyltransferase n=1 Tax=Herbivorax sp. ANBcel31 TaxID=3069754 RepID=UPI0027B6CEE7|nr:sugar phosphate nucleotidyltransferase [Herbivorax sp. ANBcel31]MDQ2087563.1 sugar phosphate nucleotidyltransferase [Herbivorax sp. ANBcel31]